MKLTDNPTKEQLRELIASRDDDAANHVMWVDHAGQVYLVPLDDSTTPSQYATHLKQDMRFRFETFERGNDYVGEAASQDEEHVDSLFDHLLESWQKGKTGYVDY